jgi:uncharacterized protein YdhG (YjbR/CyaY superfamily)
MQSNASNPEQYIAELPDERKEAMSKLREIILKNIPDGFEEQMSYGMLGYVVPHSIYPAGYHCTPKLPLPFINLASQKNFISLHHMGLYTEGKLLEWFLEEFAKTGYKLDMGKCCVRFKNMSKIPFDLIEELVRKVTVNQWIETYEKLYKPK